MNSAQFFSGIKGEASTGLRGDIFERNYLKLHSNIGGKRVRELLFDIDGETIAAGDDANLYLNLPKPENIFIFSLACLAAGPDGVIPGESGGQITISHRFKKFGDHVIMITNQTEFFRRLSIAISTHPYLYDSDYFEGGHGQVEYIDMHNHNGLTGLFRKDLEYAWQSEYRLCLGARAEALNAHGALELDIGDISDISNIIPTEKFVSSPITIRRGVAESINGVLQHRYTDL
ncbi:hypothetical protein C5I_0135885 [Pseudomonas syringae pv. syringae FF5]|nr:hypothetical protein C5I_0135885 [Pseudomonas syringae pv. syringae FF5]